MRVWLAAIALGVSSTTACSGREEATPAVAPSTGAERPAVPPGATVLPAGLADRLWRAYESKGPAYEPRTEQRRADGSPVYINRLILEDSPYLVQHAHNPVDWFPWGPEAFEKAQREGKPIFLSIGYSTCHWCHVMERESFDDVEVARLMNEGFVSIKVDREQRPDVDEVYMTAVQLTTGGGGWPMSSLLTPEGEPFFGGTYFPRDTFVQLLDRARQAWRDHRPELEAQAGQVSAAVARATAAAAGAAAIDEPLLARAVEASLARHDSELGGFSPSPKFPHEPELLFLLERVVRSGDPRALAAVETSLDRMARGGIYDQVGGGFHRYSTDSRWLVPHFEKMLYNQAHLARAYLGAARITGDALYERVARQTLDYVLRDMTSPEGAFYSATDADSEEEEGRFFTWTPAEIRAALPGVDAELAIRLFGVTEAGNFERRTILNLPKPLPEVASELGIPLANLLARLDRTREALYRARERRIHPLRDEKIVTEWNAMMITALAETGDALGDERYLDAARRAARFLWQHNRRDDGGLWRARLAGSSSIEASQGDYAYLVEALVALYDATGERSWLEQAQSTTDAMLARFWDAAAGGFFLSEDDHGGRLPTRPKSPTDGATPSGNSVAVRALAKLAARTGEELYRQRARETLTAFSGQISRAPTAFGYMLAGAAELAHGGAGPIEYGALGNLRVRVSPNGTSSAPGRVKVSLDLASGWHINSDEPLSEDLVPTRLDAGLGTEIIDFSYPEAELVHLGFQNEPLAVFQGSAPIRVAIQVEGSRIPRIARLELTFQACDDQKCLRPETLELKLPLPPSGGSVSGAGPQGAGRRN